MAFDLPLIYTIENMEKYYIGTAGWSYKDWEGIVYPERKESGFHALVYLAAYINTVEINSTFYRPPTLQISLSWIKRVEGFPSFLFTVKLHQMFTHERKDFGQRDIDSFKLGVEPLRAHGRLAAILIQFPWSFMATTANFAYLARLFEHFKELPKALEVRHTTWNQPQFYRLLEDNNVAFCNIDQPLFKNSIQPSALCTNREFSYVRLHGRNYDNWFKQGAGRDARYDYLYAQDELQEWVDRIKELGSKSDKVFVITNNHYRGQALANALQIKNMISGESLDIPLPLLRQYPALKKIIDRIKDGQLNLFEE
jgi:uncharacterized protein YecE (DUF72 family)